MLCVGIIVLLSFLQLAEPRSVVGEPQCSPYDFFERTLDKVIRVEHETELFKDKVDKMEDRIRDRLEQQLHDKLKDMEGNMDKRGRLEGHDQALHDKLKDMEGNMNRLLAFRDSTTTALEDFTKTRDLVENQKKELLTIRGMISFILY